MTGGRSWRSRSNRESVRRIAASGIRIPEGSTKTAASPASDGRCGGFSYRLIIFADSRNPGPPQIFPVSRRSFSFCLRNLRASGIESGTLPWRYWLPAARCRERRAGRSPHSHPQTRRYTQNRESRSSDRYHRS